MGPVTMAGVSRSSSRNLGTIGVELLPEPSRWAQDEEAFKDVCTLEAIAEAHEGEVRVGVRVVRCIRHLNKGWCI